MISLSVMLIFYILSILILKKRPDSLIYLMCLVVPFYDPFNSIFIKMSVLSIRLTLKPFLFFEISLILLCIREILKRKKFISDLKLLNKLSFVFLFSFAALATFYTFMISPNSYVGINMCLMISLIILLPYYYKDKKVSLDMALGFLFTGLLLSFLPTLLEMLMSRALLVPETPNVYFKIYGLPFLMLSFLVIFGYLIADDKRNLLFFTLLLFLNFCMIFLTKSRSSWLALFLCLPVYILFLVNRTRFLKLSRMRIFSLYIILLAAFFLTDSLDNPVTSDFKALNKNIHIASTDLKPPSNVDPVTASIENKHLRTLWLYLAHERTIAWRNTLSIMARNPFASYGLVYRSAIKGTHNTLLRVFLSSGAIGLLSYLVGFFMVFIAVIRKISSGVINVAVRFFYFSLMMAIFAWGFYGIFQTSLNEYMPWFFTALIFINNYKKGNF